MRMLIVDDEQDIRESLAEFFQDQGYDVNTAANGSEALIRLESGERPGVILLDLLMPIMNGRDLYNRLRADPELDRIPIIILTSDPSRAPVGPLVLKKPVGLPQLLRVVREVAF